MHSHRVLVLIQWAARQAQPQQRLRGCNCLPVPGYRIARDADTRTGDALSRWAEVQTIDHHCHVEAAVGNRYQSYHRGQLSLVWPLLCRFAVRQQQHFPTNDSLGTRNDSAKRRNWRVVPSPKTTNTLLKTPHTCHSAQATQQQKRKKRTAELRWTTGAVPRRIQSHSGVGDVRCTDDVLLIDWCLLRHHDRATRYLSCLLYTSPSPRDRG